MIRINDRDMGPIGSSDGRIVGSSAGRIVGSSDEELDSDNFVCGSEQSRFKFPSLSAAEARKALRYQRRPHDVDHLSTIKVSVRSEGYHVLCIIVTILNFNLVCFAC